ncbi:hypothetical protein BGZ83_007032 [Gryganskiella cystojenkinii]|nr:hypothetical protein BGZ83_007032 [Gryganskiella cystojenkinii]
MNWIKTKMGAHGWDITDDDVKKPSVLFLGPMEYAHQEMEDFQEYFVVKYHEGTRDDLMRRLKKGKYNGFAAIVWNPKDHSLHGRLDKELVSCMPASLSLISVPAAGYDKIDVDACTARGILVTNTPGVVSAATADTAIYLMMGCLRHYSQAQALLREGAWKTGLPRGHEVANKTIGILGLGGIGKAIAKRATAFGMVVNYYNRNRVDIRVEAEYNAHFVAYETLLRESDVIVICVPLTDATRHMIGAVQFEKMKKGVVVVNIARGAIIDEDALVKALESGRVSSAGLDVYENEPKIHEGLLKHPRCTLLPHMGTNTEETTLDMENLAIRNTKNYLMHGEKKWAINKLENSKPLEAMMTDSVDISKLSLTLQG